MMTAHFLHPCEFCNSDVEFYFADCDGDRFACNHCVKRIDAEDWFNDRDEENECPICGAKNCKTLYGNLYDDNEVIYGCEKCVSCFNAYGDDLCDEVF